MLPADLLGIGIGLGARCQNAQNGPGFRVEGLRVGPKGACPQGVVFRMLLSWDLCPGVPDFRFSLTLDTNLKLARGKQLEAQPSSPTLCQSEMNRADARCHLDATHGQNGERGV